MRVTLFPVSGQSHRFPLADGSRPSHEVGWPRLPHSRSLVARTFASRRTLGRLRTVDWRSTASTWKAHCLGSGSLPANLTASQLAAT